MTIDIDLLKDHINQNYQIGLIINIEKTTLGSGNTYIVYINHQKFIAKLFDCLDFILLYDRLESILTKLGYIQSKIVRTKKDELMTSESVVLYTFLNGEIHKVLNMVQIENAIKYIKYFNHDLL